MPTIPFPHSYKKALINKTKNTTIRTGNEVGQYKVGKIYHATTYHGKSWGIKIKIQQIVQTNIKSLAKHGIPKRSINSVTKKEKLDINTQIEIIKFIII